MKSLFDLSKRTTWALMISCFGILALSASCTKDNPEPEPIPTGDAKVRFINANSGSIAQGFYVNEVRLGTQSVGYGAASTYETTSTSNLRFSFNDAGTTTINSTVTGRLEIGGNYSFYYFKTTGNNNAILPLRDDVAVPAAGNAKVRFLHLNSFIANTFPLTITVQGSSTALVSSITADYYTNFYEVDATSKFTITGLTNPISFNDITLVAGKIYTIWLGGTSSAVLTANVVLQN